MKSAFWAAVLLVLLATAAIRFRFLETPLERDEGEYAYVGQLMLQGIPPYQIACNMKLPGTYTAYAALMAMFGQTIRGVHLGLLVVNAGAIILVALIGRRLFGTVSGIAGCAAYALMSMGAGVLGIHAHATHFVVVPALAGVLLLLHYSESRRTWTLVWSGLFFGIAFVMKQQGIFFGVFGALYLAATERRERGRLPVRLGAFLGAMLVPFGLTCLILWRAGVFAKFWFWAFDYARAYTSEVSLAEGLLLFALCFTPILQENAVLWAMAPAGLLRARVNPAWRRSATVAIALFALSFLAVCPGLYFRKHYFVLLLPAVALLAGAAVRDKRSSLVFGAALLLSVFVQRDFLFRVNGREANRLLYKRYGSVLFSEVIPIADYIRNHTKLDDRIAILGAEPEIYFYSNRHSASSYIYTDGLMEPQPYALFMQQDMIREVSGASPEFIVEVVGSTSWLTDKTSPTFIYKWWLEYRASHYRRVCFADIPARGPTLYRWDAEAEKYEPQSIFYVAVYRRDHSELQSPRGVR